jgi:hypothetical protein
MFLLAPRQIWLRPNRPFAAQPITSGDRWIPCFVGHQPPSDDSPARPKNSVLLAPLGIDAVAVDRRGRGPAGASAFISVDQRFPRVLGCPVCDPVPAGHMGPVSTCCSQAVRWYNHCMVALRHRSASAVRRGNAGHDRLPVAGGWSVCTRRCRGKARTCQERRRFLSITRRGSPRILPGCGRLNVRGSSTISKSS